MSILRNGRVAVSNLGVKGHQSGHAANRAGEGLQGNPSQMSFMVQRNKKKVYPSMSVKQQSFQ